MPPRSTLGLLGITMRIPERRTTAVDMDKVTVLGVLKHENIEIGQVLSFSLALRFEPELTFVLLVLGLAHFDD